MERKTKVSAICTCYKNGERFLPVFLGSIASQTIRDQAEVVLVHYNPNDKERGMVDEFQQKYPGLLNYVVGPQENVAKAMNRGIKNSNGEYVCIWNIDDLRTPESLELQMKTLDENPNIEFTYGDFIMVNEWEKKIGRNITLPEFDKREGIRSMIFGPFYMWRKRVHQKIGYFDEQFNSATDFDFSSRLSVKYDAKKTKGHLGYYLDAGIGISTAKGDLPKVERTMVELRYGAYRKVDFIYLQKAKKYNIQNILEENKWTNVDSLFPERKNFMDSKIWWMYNVLTYPFRFLNRVRLKLTRMYYQNYV